MFRWLVHRSTMGWVCVTMNVCCCTERRRLWLTTSQCKVSTTDARNNGMYGLGTYFASEMCKARYALQQAPEASFGDLAQAAFERTGSAQAQHRFSTAQAQHSTGAAQHRRSTSSAQARHSTGSAQHRLNSAQGSAQHKLSTAHGSAQHRPATSAQHRLSTFWCARRAKRATRSVPCLGLGPLLAGTI